MEPWTHSPVKDFKTILFTDTNILCFLVDETYPNLNSFIAQIKEHPFIELSSSEYVLLEFIGVRKREHYLSESVLQTQRIGKKINLSSLLKYHNQYSLPEINFFELLPQIKENIDKEKEKITLEYGISFNSVFHRSLISPTSDICLSSKISKEDSLVLTSSVFPTEGFSNDSVIILTNDSDFDSWFNQEETETNINDIFMSYRSHRPDLLNLKKININGKVFNLTSEIVMDDFMDNFNKYILEKVKTRMNNFYIGESFTPASQSFPQDCVSLKVKTDLPIHNNKYITIIGHDSSFVYNPENKISFWYNGGEISDDGFVAVEGSNNLSFKVEINNNDPNKTNILTSLKEPGNLIFFHPDN